MSPERPSLSNDGGPTIFDTSMVPLAAATTQILSHFPIDATTATAVVNSDSSGGNTNNNSLNHSQSQQQQHHFILQNHGNTITVNQNHTGSHSPSHHFSAAANNNNNSNNNNNTNNNSNSDNISVSIGGGSGSGTITTSSNSNSDNNSVQQQQQQQNHLNGCQIYTQVASSTSPLLGTVVTTVLQNAGSINGNNNSNIYSISNGMTALTSSSAASNAIPSSKLLVLQQHPTTRTSPQPPTQQMMQHIESFIAESNLNGANHITSYQNGVGGSNTVANGNSNNCSLGPQHIGGNIVLLATEPVEITHSEHDAINNNNILSNGNSITIATTDEELTPLHWLHDKNLLKGINLSCNKNQSTPGSPRHSSGRLSPTSDFVEDSVSEDNNSSVNSNCEQSSIYSSDSSPHRSIITTNGHYSTGPQNLSLNNRGKSTNGVSLNPPKSPMVVEFKPVTGYNATVVTYSSNGSSVTHSPPNSNSSWSSTTPIHFHKKYLREEHMKQIQQEMEISEEPQNLSSPVNYSTNKQSNREPTKAELKQDIDFDDFMRVPYRALSNHSSTMSSVSSSPSIPESDLHQQQQQQQMINFNNNDSYNEKFNGNNGGGGNNVQNKNKHPNNLPYDPLLHTNSKPPYSFSCLIFMAIEDSPTKALPVKEIYSWITSHFPYFKTAPNGWKNSVRHNLSLNKSFQKVEKAANLGKGSLWMVDEQYRPNLIQALTRSPFHPMPSIEKSLTKAMNSMPTQLRTTPVRDVRPTSPSVTKHNSKPKQSLALSNPEVFPFLARRLAAMDGKQSDKTYLVGDAVNGTGVNVDDDTKTWHADSIEDVHAAAAMLALKHGPRIYSEVFQNGNPPIITTSPSEDHTYSAGGNRSGNSSDVNSNGTSSDAAYESGDEVNNSVHHELEEQRRLEEGADALLNLAGIATTTRDSYYSNSSSAQSTPLKRSHSDHELQQQTNCYTNNAGGTQSSQYYSASNQTYITHSYSTPPKKHKSRMLKQKLKRKASWLR